MSILINGVHHDVPGVRTLAPLAEPWNKLVRGVARTAEPKIKIIHKTMAEAPEKILEDVGPSADYGDAKDTVLYWQNRRDKSGNPAPVSGTHLVTGHDGSTVNTSDCHRFTGWHAHQANARSWGHEIKEYANGRVHRSALKACVAVTLVDTVALGVQWQCPTHYRKNTPLPRFADGGRNLIGVFGHNHVTTERDANDPGVVVFDMLEAAGFERFDFYAGQDLDVWAVRQEWLRELGLYDGAIDGVPGEKTRLALEQLGYPGGIFARWRELPEKPPMPTLVL